MNTRYQYHINIDELNRVVVVHGRGGIGNIAADKMFSEASRVMQELGFKRLLLDNRQVELVEPLQEIVEFVKRLKARNMFDSVRVARVVRLDSYRQELVEQIACLNGIKIRNFDEIDKALAWLVSDTIEEVDDKRCGELK